MRRRFRLGRHQLDIAVETESDEEPPTTVELPKDAEVIHSSTKTWSFGSTEEAPPTTEGEARSDAPIDVVAADPFRLRNLLLVPSALFIGLGFIGQDNSGWYWLLAVLGFGGIAVWAGVRRWEKRR